jgi:hypothetical protein
LDSTTVSDGEACKEVEATGSEEGVFCVVVSAGIFGKEDGLDGSGMLHEQAGSRVFGYMVLGIWHVVYCYKKIQEARPGYLYRVVVVSIEKSISRTLVVDILSAERQNRG